MSKNTQMFLVIPIQKSKRYFNVDRAKSYRRAIRSYTLYYVTDDVATAPNRQPRVASCPDTKLAFTFC